MSPHESAPVADGADVPSHCRVSADTKICAKLQTDIHSGTRPGPSLSPGHQNPIRSDRIVSDPLNSDPCMNPFRITIRIRKLHVSLSIDRYRETWPICTFV